MLEKELQSLDEQLSQTQTINFYPPPTYIMSPRMKLYKAKDIITRKGYLSFFEPSDMFSHVSSAFEVNLIFTDLPNQEDDNND